MILLLKMGESSVNPLLVLMCTLPFKQKLAVIQGLLPLLKWPQQRPQPGKKSATNQQTLNT